MTHKPATMTTDRLKGEMWNFKHGMILGQITRGSAELSFLTATWVCLGASEAVFKTGH